MKAYPFNKIFNVDTQYRAETDKALVIHKVGTNSTTQVTLTIDGSPVLELIDTLANKEVLAANLLGPVSLGAQYLVVPQTKTFSFTGEAASELRLIGQLIHLAPGESLSGDLMARFAAAPGHQLNYLEATYDHGADITWSAGHEETILEFTGLVAEEYLFNRFFGVTILTGAAVTAQNAFAIRTYIDDFPLDNIDSSMAPLGMEAYSMPLPPKDTFNSIPYSLVDSPHLILEGVTLRMTAINVSGADIVPAGGEHITTKIQTWVERTLRGR